MRDSDADDNTAVAVARLISPGMASDIRPFHHPQPLQLATCHGSDTGASIILLPTGSFFLLYFLFLNIFVSFCQFGLARVNGKCVSAQDTKNLTISQLSIFNHFLVISITHKHVSSSRKSFCFVFAADSCNVASCIVTLHPILCLMTASYFQYFIYLVISMAHKYT